MQNLDGRILTASISCTARSLAPNPVQVARAGMCTIGMSPQLQCPGCVVLQRNMQSTCPRASWQLVSATERLHTAPRPRCPSVPGVGCWVESKVIVATTTVRRAANRFRDAIENVQWSGLCGMTPKPLANHVRDCALKAVVGVRLPPISRPYVLKNSSTVNRAYVVRAQKVNTQFCVSRCCFSKVPNLCTPKYFSEYPRIGLSIV